MLGVQDTDSCRVHISEVFFTFHRLPVGSLWFPLVSTGQSCRGDGTCASEGGRKLKAKRGGGNKGALKCGGRALTGLTHALTLTALGEENRSSYPRGPRGGNRGGVNCQRLLSPLMQGLERAEAAVRPSWSRFSTCHSSGHCLKPRTALSGWGPTANSAAPMLTLMRWLGSIGRAASHRRLVMFKKHTAEVPRDARARGRASERARGGPVKGIWAAHWGLQRRAGKSAIEHQTQGKKKKKKFSGKETISCHLMLIW